MIFPGGDGWLYALEPETGKLIWKFDANPKDAKYELGGKGTRERLHRHAGRSTTDRIYIGTGQDPEHFDGVGHFWCIDPTQGGGRLPGARDGRRRKDPPATKPNPNSAVVWHYGGDDKRPFAKRDFVFGRTMSTACIVDDVVYIARPRRLPPLPGREDRQEVLAVGHEVGHLGLVLLRGRQGARRERGRRHVLLQAREDARGDGRGGRRVAGRRRTRRTKAKAAGKDEPDARKAGTRRPRRGRRRRCARRCKAKYLLQKVEVGEPIRSTPIVANGVLYIMTEKTLYAVNAK